MVQIGYALSSEEFKPKDLVALAVRAEEVGFPFLLVSDHFHPWLDTQGQSPFVWSTLGGIAVSTKRLQFGTGVTCPLIRIHPAIIAQAAETANAMSDGRFFLGIGTGEYLNEHVTGQHWPVLSTRQEMLREAVEIIRALQGGDYVSHSGRYYQVENARLYTRHSTPTPIYVAASGPASGELAGEIGEGLISTSPTPDVVQAFQAAHSGTAPRYGQMTVCWNENEQTAQETALKYWANSAIPGQLSQELALPEYFGAVSQLVTTEQIAKTVICGPDPAGYRAKIDEFVKAGFDHVYIHQIGPDQEGFFSFAKQEILPRYAG
jgi:G6PDH family F420-dependent oxidoreductase